MEHNANQALDPLETIGAQAMAGIVRGAVSMVFPQRTIPKDYAHRHDALDAGGEALEDQLNSLDDLFYEHPDDLTALLLAYVQVHH